jgi:hypothetical protein
MPSDARTLRALDALAEHRDRYRSAVSAAHDQMAGYLAAHRARTQGNAQTAARELGRFAAGRIDTERFGALFAEAHVLSADTTERVERLVGVLAELLAEGDELFLADVPPGGDLRAVVDVAIAQAGRVFGAVLAFQAVKTGTYRPERNDPDILAFPFSRWNRSERLLALPLVVEVDGADLRADALAEYLDGRMVIALVVRDASTPAPLVRLITPGTLVVQGTEVADLGPLAAYDGPAIAALVSAPAARFVHDPRAGRTLPARLNVTYMPADTPRKPLGTRSVWQQQQEIAQLQELRSLTSSTVGAVSAAAVVPTATVQGGSTPSSQTVDLLANWLLAEAGYATANSAVGGTG